MRWILVFVFLVAGCTGDSEPDKADLVVKVEELGEDIHIPSKMWDYSWEGASDFSFSEVQVHLKEKFTGVLKSPHIEIQLPSGGGQIDLADYLTGRRGTFYLSISQGGLEELEQESLFFISRNTQVLSFGESIGSGCHKLLVLNEEFKKEFRHSGIEINSTDGRHLSIVGGSFVILQKVEGQNQMSQVTFIDSRFQDRACTKEIE